MKLTALALAAALCLPAAAQTDPTNWGNIIKIGGGAAIVKSILDVYDWVRGKLVPNPRTLHYCAPSQCNFSAAGTPPTQHDLDMALSFIATIGKTWNPGEVITLCNGWTCIDFEHTESGFVPIASYEDPNVGYTNRPRGYSDGGGTSNFVAPNHYGTNLSVGGGGGRIRIGVVTVRQSTSDN
jgi:hypothetical protein